MSKSILQFRIMAASVFLAGFMCLVGVRLYHVQIVRHEEYYSKAKQKYTSVRNRQGERGKIFDIKGNLLVGNIPCFEIIADPRYTGDDDRCRETAVWLAGKVGVPATKIFKNIATKTSNGKERQYAFIAKDISIETGKEIEDYLHENRLKGIHLIEKSKRYYPKNELVANILGIINVDGENVSPVNGVEKLFNGKISPTDSRLIFAMAMMFPVKGSTMTA